MPPANMLMELPADPELRVKVENCLAAFDFDAEALLFGTDPESLSGMLEPCPCTLAQAQFDYGRFTPQTVNPPDSRCYVSTNPIGVRLLVDVITLTQQCCYDSNG